MKENAPSINMFAKKCLENKFIKWCQTVLSIQFYDTNHFITWVTYLPTGKNDGAYFHIQRQQISISEKNYRHAHCEASYGNPGAQAFTNSGCFPKETTKSISLFKDCWKVHLHKSACTNPQQHNCQKRMEIEQCRHVLLLIFELTLMASLPSNLKVTVQLPSKLAANFPDYGSSEES